MLIFGLIGSAVLLTVVNSIAHRSKKPGRPIVGVCLVFLIGPTFFNPFPTMVPLLALVLLFALMEWRSAQRGPSYFLRLSVGAMLFALIATGLQVFQAERGYARLRARYPFESLEARLPAPKPASRARPVALDPLGPLAWLDGDFGDRRSYHLKRLHENAVELFIDSPGFGSTRAPRLSESSLAMYREPVPLQPGPRIASESSPGEWMSPSVSDEEPLAHLFAKSVFDFVNPRGFGYFKDRRHVAGFETHRFSDVPWSWSPDRWQVQTLDLIGLILHDEPRAYVSDHLPSMDELRAAPTRPLDKFEAVSLNSIQSGEELVIARVGDATRMLGAIRSLKQCVACHGGERGDLLGAFTYTLRRDKHVVAGDSSAARRVN